MRYCDSHDLKPGMVLAKPLYSDMNELLLSRGYELNEGLIARIQHMGISPVCIEESGTEMIIVDDLVDGSILHEAQGSVKEVFDQVIQATKSRVGEDVSQIAGDLKASGFSVPVDQVKKIISSLIDELLDNMTTEWNILPAKYLTTGNYFRHSTDVALLSLLIGIYFQFRYRELKSLGFGAMLHDIGKSLIPEIIDKKHCDFTPEELSQYRKHPHYGVTLVAGSEETNFLERECIYQHHEQPDGKGFPQGLISSQQLPNQRSNPAPGEIFRLAEIIHVADAYLNLTTGGWPLEPISPEDSITEIIRNTPAHYNHHIVGALSQVIVRFPKGAHVRLVKNSSLRYIGFHGVVAEPNKQEPHKPALVLFANRFGEKITPFPVDFSQEKSMEIKLVI